MNIYFELRGSHRREFWRTHAVCHGGRWRCKESFAIPAERIRATFIRYVPDWTRYIRHRPTVEGVGRRRACCAAFPRTAWLKTDLTRCTLPSFNTGNKIGVVSTTNEPIQNVLPRVRPHRYAHQPVGSSIVDLIKVLFQLNQIALTSLESRIEPPASTPPYPPPPPERPAAPTTPTDPHLAAAVYIASSRLRTSRAAHRCPGRRPSAPARSRPARSRGSHLPSPPAAAARPRRRAQRYGRRCGRLEAGPPGPRRLVPRGACPVPR